MDYNQLYEEVSKYGTIEMIKASESVFSLLITNINMTNLDSFSSIQENVIKYAKDKYAYLDVMTYPEINTNYVYCIVLKKIKN